MPGIGPKVRTALLMRFGSIAAIHAASDAELLKTERVTRRHVAALRRSRETEAESDSALTPDAPEARELQDEQA